MKNGGLKWRFAGKTNIATTRKRNLNVTVKGQTVKNGKIFIYAKKNNCLEKVI